MPKAQLQALPSLPAVSQPELRSAERSSLLLRSAKLICQSGEYICLVRDVSTSGLRLRLFHELPAETYVFLELANGEIYPMENVWRKPGEAGFRFTAPINVADFIEEASPFARRQIRLRMERHGRLLSEGRSAPVILRDISQAGARIETSIWLALEQPVRLVIDGLPERFARVRWRERYEHGLAFDQGFRLDELALHAATLQPFAG